MSGVWKEQLLSWCCKITEEADASVSLQVPTRDVERYGQIYRKKKIILETCEGGFWMDHTSMNIWRCNWTNPLSFSCWETTVQKLLGNSPMKRLWSTASEVSRSFGQALASFAFCLQLLKKKSTNICAMVLYGHGISMDKEWLHFGGSSGKYRYMFFDCQRVNSCKCQIFSWMHFSV